MRPRYSRSEMQKKTRFSFVFHSLILHLWRYAPKVLTFGNAKENEVFFCISLTYSYLCTKQKNIDYDIY
ncbi:hypothetical protein CIK97_06860 [Prevotella sp. P3-120]|nr:hypothetical protein CIK97_06860 [Prevotella sp. P3-120]